MSEVIGINPGVPDFVVAAAKQLQLESYWPSLQYPDREVWLRIRLAQRDPLPEVVIHSGKQPLVLGLNAAKRSADETFKQRIYNRNVKHAAKNGSRHALVKHRHAYYRSRHLGIWE